MNHDAIPALMPKQSKWALHAIVLPITLLAFVSEMGFAQGTARQCIEYVRTDVVGALAPYIDTDSDPNSVHREFDSPRGWHGDVLARWSKPPAVICDGDEVSYFMEIVNNSVHPEDPGGYAGSITLAPTPSFTVSFECEDTDDRPPANQLHVMISQPGGTSRCTAVIRTGALRSPGVEREVFAGSVNVAEGALIYYVYRPAAAGPKP